MWPFSGRQHQETPRNHPSTTPAQLETSEDRPQSPNAELVAQISQLTAEVGAVRQEWAETLERLNRWSKRQSARERRELHAALDGEGMEVAEEETPEPIPVSAGNGSQMDRAAMKAQLRAQLRQRGMQQ